MSPSYTIIRGGRLVDVARHEAPPTDILIEGDTILEVGAPGLAAPAEATVVDAAGMLLHPGLINAHTHGHGNLAKGMGDRWSLELLLTAAPWIGGGRELEDKYLTTLIGAAEMLTKGCTACYDLSFEFPSPTVDGMAACAKAYRDAGLRAVLAPMVADTTLFEAIPGLMDALPPALQKDAESYRLAPTETTLQRIREIVRGFDVDRDLVRPAVAPTIPHHCTTAFLEGCRDIAREHGLGLHSHVAEGKVQAIAGRKLYGSTLLQHMDALGLVGPDFVVAHGVWLDDEDMRRLAFHGGSVAHNPGSNALLGSGIADARRMLELGVNLAIGTDGANCCDNQNMYESLRTASYVSHVKSPDTERWLATSEILRAATEGSAKALGFPNLGRIAPGFKADIVFVDLGTINWLPFNDPVNQLVHTEDGTGVHSVMVGGAFKLRDRKLVDVDLAKLATEAEHARERLARINAERKEVFRRLAPVVNSYCPGLAYAPYHVHRYGAPLAPG
ncbi:MAG: amidohydrolase family protein [Pseudomonadota bacterium]